MVTASAGSTPESAGGIYVSQYGAGSQDGSSEANAHPVTWLNSSDSWGVGAGKIAPGSLVKLCGTFAPSVDNTMITIRGAGTAGNPVTIYCRPGCVFTSPRWPNTGAIQIHQYYGANGYLIFNGNGAIIENTANGTGLAYHGASRGIFITGYGATPLTSCEVKGFTIRNIYVNGGSNPAATDTDGAATEDVYLAGNLDSVSVHDCILSNANTGISGSFDGNTWTDVELYNNYINDHSWGISIGGLTAPSLATNFRIHNNEITDWTNWQYPSSSYHTDGIITYSGETAPTYSPLIYNNYIHGDLGAGSPTGHIYCTVGNPTGVGSGCSAIVFNNLLVNTGTNAHTLLWFGTRTSNNQVYNNTIIGTVTNAAFNPCIISSAISGDVYKNNLFSTFSQIFGTQWASDPDVIIAESNNNVFYNIGTPNFGGSSETYTLTQWRALGSGHDENSVTTDPKLTGTYHLGSGSSATGIGANLSSLGIIPLDNDKSGNARGVGAWDAGAYKA
jgi:hypothetical protein